MSEEILSGQKSLHFVLVHGAGHGAWCWYKLRCLMETSGYKVTCLDLKGAGIDLTDPGTVDSFDEYNQPLIDFFLQDLVENEKDGVYNMVILVGHSAGGLSVTDCIHRFGTKKIHMAFYVAANMLKNGFVTDQDFKDGMPDLPEPGKIPFSMIPLEDSTLRSMLLRPQPKGIGGAKFTDGPDADNVPRVCIRALYDPYLKADKQQAAMIKRWPPSQVFDIESDHSPFFSSPFVLFGFIVKAVASIKL
ncbi:hypothetical protein Ddye_019831 [Dipteronia dyeriana]|uniref:AB hydrolase-1 domain-containing protein n=1 Tax=Dipteronia dyeriana TaxID=168575 RepID=A0AAD9TYP7_9ROSI|nr:hypothetical protein Ddye_019831 [Dipteronia dyeriana]